VERWNGRSLSLAERRNVSAVSFRRSTVPPFLLSSNSPIAKENHCAKKSAFVFCATITNGICLAPDVGDRKTRRFSQLEILAAPTPRTTN